MQFTTIATLALLQASVVHFGHVAASPLVRRDGPCDSYDGGDAVAARKQQLLAEGATVQDLAITILETGAYMNATYPYGDNKSEDAANFGMFKNNWFALRTYCSQFQGQTTDDWNNGAELNTDDVSTINCQHEQISILGDQQFYNLQRNGNTATEADDYAAAVNYNMDQLNQGHTTDGFLPCYSLEAI